MNETNLSNIFAGPWFYYILLTLTVLYLVLSRKVRVIPKIPVLFFCIYFILKIFGLHFGNELSTKNLNFLNFVITTLLYFAVVRLAFYITVERYYIWKKRSALPKISRDFALIVLFAIIALVLMRTQANFNLAGILTTSAVMTAAIGFAAQNTLSNLFSGLSIQLDDPFSVGDWIRVGDSVGQVVEIGWKTTEIKTPDDEIIILPNLEIAKALIKNYSRPTDQLLMKLSIGIDYKTSPEKVEKAILEACGHETAVLADPKPEVRLMQFGDSAIIYEVRIAYRGFQNRLALISRINKLIWYSLKRNNIDIPYPIRDIRHHHIEAKSAQEKIAALKKEARENLNAIPLFASLGDVEKDEVADHMEVLTYADGETIVRQGEEGDSAFIIHSGQCGVIVDHGSGPAVRVTALPQKTLFGEMSLLTGAPRTATVKAEAESVVFKIGKDVFKTVLTKDPSLSEKLADILLKRETALAQHKDDTLKNTEKKTDLLEKIRRFFS